MKEDYNDDDQGIFVGVSPAVKWMRVLVPSMLIILFAMHIFLNWGRKPTIAEPVKGAPVEKTIVAH